MFFNRPIINLPEEEHRKIIMQLTDGCPGQWSYWSVGGNSHIFEFVDLNNTVDVNVEVEERDDGTVFFLNMDCGTHYVCVHNQMYDSALEAAKAARPLVELGRRQMREMKALGVVDE